jgi:hypothetical protein
MTRILHQPNVVVSKIVYEILMYTADVAKRYNPCPVSNPPDPGLRHDMEYNSQQKVYIDFYCIIA